MEKWENIEGFGDYQASNERQNKKFKEGQRKNTKTI